MISIPAKSDPQVVVLLGAWLIPHHAHESFKKKKNQLRKIQRKPLRRCEFVHNTQLTGSWKQKPFKFGKGELFILNLVENSQNI